MPVNDWIAAGKAGAKAVSDNFAVAREYSPDYQKPAEAKLDAASAERIAATKAAAKVHQAGLRAVETVKDTQIKVDSKKEILDMKLDNFRKAGIIGALGTVAAGGMSAIENNRAQKRADEREAAEQRRFDARMAYLKESNANMPKPPEVTPFEEKPFEYDDKPSSSTGSSGGSLVSSGQAVAAGKGKGSGGKMFTQSEIESLAVQAGFSPENAKIMAAIGMGESGGDSRIDTVQSGLDPGKRNEYSLGLVQINAQAHGDKLSRRGWTAEDLRDPLKNLTIAKEVYDEVGSFKPWSVYTKGIYKNYL